MKDISGWLASLGPLLNFLKELRDRALLVAIIILLLLLAAFVSFFVLITGRMPLLSTSLPEVDIFGRVAAGCVGVLLCLGVFFFLWFLLHDAESSVRANHGGATIPVLVPTKEEETDTHLLGEQQGMPSSPQASPQVDSRLLHFLPEHQRSRFRTVSLGTQSSLAHYPYQYVPTGLIMIYQIPFFLPPWLDENGDCLGHHMLIVAPTENNEIQIREVTARVDAVSKVHFLVSAGNGWAEQQGIQLLGKRVGRIEFEFADGGTQTTHLILGKHIREWAFGNSPDKLVTTIDYCCTKPAWRSEPGFCLIDALSVSVEDGPRDMVKIRLFAKIEEELGGKKISLPHIQISAITCERVEKPD